jgi:hypothetical protein
VSEQEPPGRPARQPKLPSERDWERSPVLEPLPAPRHPELIGDGGTLPFPLAALLGAPGPLDPEDPAVAALLAHLVARAAPKRGLRAIGRRTNEASADAAPSLDGWRLLARSEDQVLFAIGRPPQLLTITASAARRGRWSCAGPYAARPLRATREGIRASSWRVDPTHEPQPEETTVRVLVTEQTFASAQRASERLLAPDIYIDDDELVLRMFVTPRPGFQSGVANPETPARIALPQPLGRRRLLDGALIEFAPPRSP